MSGNTNTGKYDDIYKLLSTYKFQTNVNLSDDLKCIKCKGILINACQVPCGCRYCHQCIMEILDYGCEVCPGFTLICKDTNLLNFQTDYSGNRKISELVVKCPNETCTFECILNNMAEHVKSCLIMTNQCPFGCDVVNVTSEHFQSESLKHNTMLVNAIEKCNNKLNVNSTEFDDIKRHLAAKDEQIKIMTNDINLMKMDKTELERQLSVMRQDMNMVVEGLSVELDARLNSIIKNSEENIKRSCLNVNEENQKAHMALTRMNDEMKYLTGKIRRTRFFWNVGEISEMRRTFDSWMYSKYFCPDINRYKLRLSLFNCTNYLYVYFCIYHGAQDVSLVWPFQANVTINVMNKVSPDACKSITKYCNIPRPIGYSYQKSTQFKFQYEELSTLGVMKDNYFKIECLVE